MYAESSYSYKSGIPKQFYHLKNHDFDDWEIPPWELLIHKSKPLGKGNFGIVYPAVWRGTNVIAKVAYDPFSEKQKMLLIREFEAMTKIHHPNIVQLLGYVKDPFVIVMEYLEKDNLKTYLNQNNLTDKQKLIICVDILRALAYLHKRKPQYIIHRDIKLTNILVSCSGKIKLGDFGLSRLMYQEERSIEQLLEMDVPSNDLTGDVGTLRYMAPEMKSGKYNFKVDIWSAGILFKEIFETFTNSEIKNIIDTKMIVDSKYRLNAEELIVIFESINFSPKNNVFCCLLN
jgi:serine/threonine protein kinase